MKTEDLLINIERQLDLLQGVKYYADIKTFATVGRGIEALDQKRQEECVQKYENYSGKVAKFIPASGAASRMFAHLIGLANSSSIQARNFLEKMGDMPFIDELNTSCLEKYNCTAKNLLDSDRLTDLEKIILSEDGLNYANLPKGLIPFHSYENETRTALEEHIIEGLKYVFKGNKCKLHFTVSQDFKSEIEDALHEFLKRKNLPYVELEFSVQKPETHTIALAKSGDVLKDENNEVVLRPGGHGALIHNLNSIDSDLVFIKNVDNVVVESELDHQVYWKKVLAGRLLEVQKEIFMHLTKLESGKGLDQAKKFIADYFYYTTKDITIEEAKNLLKRPLRVCGMVPNQGLAGGGPFIVKEKKGTSLQIVESAEINKLNESQLRALRKSTHFNPVDIVCGLKDTNGNKYNLLEFVNEKACFTSYKQFNNQEIKILELPGLWNGSMAKWNTLFIEVPASTFNPVKTVNDLAKSQHQAL